jgi:hypothetical protein
MFDVKRRQFITLLGGAVCSHDSQLIPSQV